MKKQKFHRIGNSKEPTPSRMLKMAMNLSNRFSCYANVIVSCKSHKVIDSTYQEYGIYLSAPWFDKVSIGTKWYQSWAVTLNLYRSLMRREIDGS